jgi:hypothetical protein
MILGPDDEQLLLSLQKAISEGIECRVSYSTIQNEEINKICNVWIGEHIVYNNPEYDKKADTKTQL